MRTIWKYLLEVTDRQTLNMPRTAKILHVGVQQGLACLWAEVTPGAAQEERTILIAGEGHALPDDNMRYIGTFQLSGGKLIFHAYEPTP